MKDLRKEIENLINSLNDYNEVLITTKEFDDDDDELRYELPRVALVDKYGYYNEYAIVSLNGGKFKAIGISEGCHGDIIYDVIDTLNYNEGLDLLGWLNN